MNRLWQRGCEQLWPGEHRHTTGTVREPGGYSWVRESDFAAENDLGPVRGNRHVCTVCVGDVQPRWLRLKVRRVGEAPVHQPHGIIEQLDRGSEGRTILLQFSS